MNEPGIVGFIGRASGDFMREFTTAWRQGVPVAPPGHTALSTPSGQPTVAPNQPTTVNGQPAPTASASQGAQQVLTTLSNRIAALEANVRQLERSRLEAVVHAHAVHALFGVLLQDHLSIRVPDFKDAIQTAIRACSEVQEKLALSGRECNPELFLSSDGYNKILRSQLRDAISLAEIPASIPDSKPTDG